MIKLENGKILTEARYRFDVLTEPEVSNDPGNSDSPPTVPEELMHLFQFEIYESDDSSVFSQSLYRPFSLSFERLQRILLPWLQNDIDVSNI
jgi:hypothetical protein